jgi:hypothetical protein
LGVSPSSPPVAEPDGPPDLVEELGPEAVLQHEKSRLLCDPDSRSDSYDTLLRKLLLDTLREAKL